MSTAMYRFLIIIIAMVAVTCVQLSTAKSLVGTFNAFQTIEAEDYSFSNFSHNFDACTEPIVYLGNNGPTSTVAYYSVDFANGAVKINSRIACWITSGQSGTIDLHLDSPQSTAFATIDLIYLGPWNCNWGMVSTSVRTIPTGVHDLYFTFTTNPYYQYGYVDIDWFSFEAPPANQTNFDAFQVIQAEDNNYIGVGDTKTCPSSSTTYVGDIKAGAVIAFFGVDFGPGAQMVQLRTASWEHGLINLHLDSTVDPPFVTIPIQKVEPDVDNCNFIMFEQFVSTVPTGVHNLYFTFDFPSGVQSFVNIDWFTFKSTSA